MSESSNNLDALRVELFSTLRALRDPDKPMELDRARAVADIAGRIIDSAKVEVEHAKVTERLPATRFFVPDKKQLPAPPSNQLHTDLVGVAVREPVNTGPKASL